MRCANSKRSTTAATQPAACKSVSALPYEFYVQTNQHHPVCAQRGAHHQHRSEGIGGQGVGRQRRVLQPCGRRAGLLQAAVHGHDRHLARLQQDGRYAHGRTGLPRPRRRRRKIHGVWRGIRTLGHQAASDDRQRYWCASRVRQERQRWSLEGRQPPGRQRHVPEGHDPASQQGRHGRIQHGP